MLTHVCANCVLHTVCERNEWLQNGRHRRVEHQKLRQRHAWQQDSWTQNFSFPFQHTVSAVTRKQQHPHICWSMILFLYTAPFMINWQWQSKDTLSIWLFLEESLLIVCFIFSRHLTTGLGWPFHSCCHSHPKCLPQCTSNLFRPTSVFVIYVSL